MTSVPHLAKLSTYVRRFGLLHGLRLLLSMEREWPSKSNVVRKYAVPGYPPIYLRDTVSDHSIFWQCLVQCQYDFLKFRQTERLIAVYEQALLQGRRPLIIDCGANIGLATIWFASHFPKAQVYAVEPDVDNLRIIKMNTASFGERVTPVHGGIWHQRDELRIVNPTSGSAAFRVARGAPCRGSAVPAYAVSDICTMAGVDAPLIVKIDIEGAQASLFAANTGWVANTHLITLELEDWLMPWQGTSRPFFSCVSGYPFDYVIHGESLFCFHDFATEGRQQ